MEKRDMNTKKFLRGAGLALVLLLAFGVKNAAWGQQDAQFSQYIFNQIYINPASAGYRAENNVHAFFRSQWNGAPGAPQSESLAFDGGLTPKPVGRDWQVSED